MSVWRVGLSAAFAIALSLSGIPTTALAEAAGLDVSEPTLNETPTLDEDATTEESTDVWASEDADGEDPADEQPAESEDVVLNEVLSLDEEYGEDTEISLDEDDLVETEAFEENADSSDSAKTTAKTPHVLYRVHRQTYGWESGWKKDGAVSGTTNKGKRLEGIFIKLQNKPVTGSIRYRTHVQKIGWQGWKNEGQMSGTSGKGLRLEAIQIKLTGQMSKKYNVWYRVHAQHFGWMGWARNGRSAGTAHYAYRLEAIQIKLVKKGVKAPGSTSGAFRQKPYWWTATTFETADFRVKIPYKLRGKLRVTRRTGSGWEGYYFNSNVRPSKYAKNGDNVPITYGGSIMVYTSSSQRASHYYGRSSRGRYVWSGWGAQGMEDIFDSPYHSGIAKVVVK